MEEIKMYKIRWEGQVSDYERGVLNVIKGIVKTCMECCEGDIYTSYSVSGEPVSKKSVGKHSYAWQGKGRRNGRMA